MQADEAIKIANRVVFVKKANELNQVLHAQLSTIEEEVGP